MTFTQQKSKVFLGTGKCRLFPFWYTLLSCSKQSNFQTLYTRFMWITTEIKTAYSLLTALLF